MSFIKVPVVACPSSSRLFSSCSNCITSLSPCSPTQSPQPWQQTPGIQTSSGPRYFYNSHVRGQRSYATVFRDSRKDRHRRPNSRDSPHPHHHHDPYHPWPTSPQPTPYEIFDQKVEAPYSKSKFFELVKIYHPDRHYHLSPRDTSLSHAVRLERYRLVVAANDILSDPTKRRAYDLYGAGWAGKLGMESLTREAERSWRKRPGNASMNATWEDWERWYEERDGRRKRQEPVYMSNEVFVVVLCFIAIVGSMGKAKRVKKNSMNLVEMREQQDEVISHGMQQRQTSLSSLNREERVENFLRQRDGWALVSATSNHAGSDK